jgi:hypothetical protein
MARRRRPLSALVRSRATASARTGPGFVGAGPQPR